MERIKFICMECDNECQLSLRGDSIDIPEDCPIDSYDNVLPVWELDN